MITIIQSRTRKVRRLRSRRGMTLVEVMIGATLGTMILAAVISTFLFLGRSGANLRNYSDMETQSRKALEVFAEDVRQASAITWTTKTDITLRIGTSIPAVYIRYYYDSANASFHRDSSSGTQTLISGINSGSFTFKAYKVDGGEMALETAAQLTAATSSTKQLQLSLEASRTTQTVTAATNLVLSARFILRNKIVTA